MLSDACPGFLRTGGPDWDTQLPLCCFERALQNEIDSLGVAVGEII